MYGSVQEEDKVMDKKKKWTYNEKVLTIICVMSIISGLCFFMSLIIIMGFLGRFEDNIDGMLSYIMTKISNSETMAYDLATCIQEICEKLGSIVTR